MITGYSAVDTANIPTDSEVVFGYCNPPFAQLNPIQERAPHAIVFPIATHPLYMALMYDFETGALDPANAGETMHRALGHGIRYPIAYFALDDYSQVVDSLRKWKVDRRDIRLCPAHWTPSPELPDWADGVQWSNTAFGLSLNAYQLRDDFTNWQAAHRERAQLRY